MTGHGEFGKSPKPLSEASDYWLIGDQKDLRGWQDYWRFFPKVCAALITSPTILFCYMALVLIDGFLPKGTAKTLTELSSSIMALTLFAIVTQYFVSGFVEGKQPADMKNNPEVVGNFVGMCLISGLVTIILAFLFVIPSIWWATKTSLAPIVVVFERSNPWLSLKRSHELVTGRFWLVFKYLLPAAALQTAVTLFAMIFVAILSAFKAPDLVISIASIPLVLLTAILPAASVALCARIYFILKEKPA